MGKAIMTVLFAIVCVASVLTQANAQIHPRLVGDIDVFKMEDEAAERWKAALPRLAKNSEDLRLAWDRLKDRLSNTGIKWVISKSRVISSDVEGNKQVEMYEWCNYYVGEVPSVAKAAEYAEQFARLEVRVRLCEETELPSKQAKK